MQISPPVCQQAPSRGLSLKAWITVGALVTTVLVVALVTILVLILRGRSNVAHPHLLLRCTSADCVEFEVLLRNTLNTTVKPCEDFKAFVTSRWLPGYKVSNRVRWMRQWSVQAQWTRMMIDEIRHRRFSTSMMNLVANSYAACKGGASEQTEEKRMVFKQFLQNLSIPWPEMPVQTVDILDVLIKLCVKWNIPLWFNAKMLSDRTADGQKIIYIGPSDYAYSWSQIYKDMDSQAAHIYIEEYVKYFSSPLGPTHVKKKVNHFLVFNITKDIVSNLAGLCPRRSAKFTFESFAKRLGISADRLVSVTNKYFQPNESFLPTDVVIVRPAGTIDVARHFISSYGPSLIQSHLGWWVVQIFAPIINNMFFLLKYGSNSAADENRPIYCQIHTGHSFKLLVLANHIALRFPISVRQNVDLVLNNVRDEAANFFETSTPSLRKNKRIARKLRSMKIELWPKPEYLSKKFLEKIYARRKPYHRHALEHWIAERKANGELLGSDAYFESTRLADSFSDEPFVYDHVLNTATLSIAAAHAPFYYNDVVDAVNYGGLGAAFLKTVLQGIDEGEGLGNTSGPYWENTTMAKSDDSCAYNRNVSHPIKHNDQLSNISDYSPETFFFITYCHTQSLLKPWFDCNDELRGVKSFVTAFSCPRGSGMHPIIPV
ncbi:hypothetical protein HPB49_012745 [Dermacentor silvarum]|uniref:Uncharacterized protein n=1 Tax=Dermacentor silvarum TaxID=543639 RepID=A0ACB8C993_DERSI|nr:hypothetical protein HPB49_012745 [Dermacentor silvarum]